MCGGVNCAGSPEFECYLDLCAVKDGAYQCGDEELEIEDLPLPNPIVNSTFLIFQQNQEYIIQIGQSSTSFGQTVYNVHSFQPLWEFLQISFLLVHQLPST